MLRATERRLQLEKERVYTLFAVVLSMAATLYYEINRRQGVTEKREQREREIAAAEEQRYRERVGEQLITLGEDSLSHRERSAQFRRFGQALVGAAGIAVAYATLVAAHVF